MINGYLHLRKRRDVSTCNECSRFALVRDIFGCQIFAEKLSEISLTNHGPYAADDHD